MRTLLVFTLVVLSPSLALAADSGFDPSSSLLWTFAAAFGVGFLTSLTPCVYPMIPIVMGVFGARGQHVSRRRAFGLATAYVVGMGVTYSTLGVIFALAGKQFGSILSNPWFVIPIVGFYVVLAVSMFGMFEIALPASVQNRLNRVGGEGFAGAFGMGLVGGLTAAPCTGPFLAGILAFVATSGTHVTIGAALLFTYALGMGVLFWLIAAFAVSVPKSGRWMEWVKSIGAIALLGVAIYFLRPLVPALRSLASANFAFLAISIALGVGGIALGAIHLSFSGSTAARLRKAGGVALTLVGITGVIGWTLAPSASLPWMSDEASAFERAREEGKGVMIDFAAEWCLPCKELETRTFAAGEVQDQVLGNFVPLKVDVTEPTAAVEALQAKYRAMNLPAVIFFDDSGRELGRIERFLGPEAFVDRLRSFQTSASSWPVESPDPTALSHAPRPQSP